MWNASVCSANTPQLTRGGSHSASTNVCQIHHATYHISEKSQEPANLGALVNRGANGGMAESDTWILSTVPHTHVDITGVGGKVMEHLPVAQCASVMDMIDKNHIIVITSQYTHTPDID